MSELREQAQRVIDTELQRAYRKHGRLPWSRHEFYAILLEEVDELWDAIKSDAPDSDVVAEAIEVASMVFRYIETGDRYRGGLGDAIAVTEYVKLRKLESVTPAIGVVDVA